MGLWMLGIGLSLLACVFSSLGKVWLKQAHTFQSKNYWYRGMSCLLVLNPGLSAVANLFAAQSVLTPMAGMTIVFNTVLCSHVLNEPILFVDLVGTGVIVVGAIMVSVSGSHETKNLTIAQLEHCFAQESAVIYFIVLGAIILLLTFLSHYPHSRAAHLIHRFSYAALAGIIGGQLFFLKGFMIILDNGFEAVFTHFFSYFVLVGAISTALGGLFLLNVAIGRYSALYVCQVYEGMLLLNGSLSGIAVYHEMYNLELWHYIVYVTGLVFIVSGIMLISHREPRKTMAEQVRSEGMDYEAIADGRGHSKDNKAQFFALTPYEDEDEDEDDIDIRSNVKKNITVPLISKK